jgi:hypothetical protein
MEDPHPVRLRTGSLAGLRERSMRRGSGIRVRRHHVGRAELGSLVPGPEPHIVGPATYGVEPYRAALARVRPDA